MNTLDRLLLQVADPSQPLLTYYDLATGERIELSTTTTANWVAKTCNFLVDDLDAGLHTRIRIGLPTHWLSFVWILSAWQIGAAIVDSGADIGVSGPDLNAEEPIRVAASLRALGGRFLTPPPGFTDLGAEVPGHGDHFVSLDPPESATVATDLEGEQRTHADILSTGPDPTRRLVTPGTVARDCELIASACLGGGSLVVVANGSVDDLVLVTAQEGALISEAHPLHSTMPRRPGDS